MRAASTPSNVVLLPVTCQPRAVNDSASGIPSLWLNLGHGSSGWALSCGSARVLADQIAGRAPEIDTEGLDVRRLAG